MQTVLVAGWHPGSINSTIPVIRRLKQDENLEVIVLGYDASEEILEAEGIEFRTLKDFEVSDTTTVDMDHAIRHVAPDLIVMGTSTQDDQHESILEHSLIRAAAQLGVPTFAILDFWNDYKERFSDRRTHNPFDVVPNVVAVMDKPAAHAMRRAGFPEKRMIITGNPHFDKFLADGKVDENEVREFRTQLEIEGKTLFYFAGNTFRTEKARKGFWDMDVIQIIADAVDLLPDVEVIIRLHPRMVRALPEEVEMIMNFLSRRGNPRIHRHQEIDSKTLCRMSDLTIVPYSTVGVEAALMRRPVVSLQPGLKGPNDFCLSGIPGESAIQAAFTREACLGMLMQARSPHYRQKLVSNICLENDGQATDRVTKAIYQILGEGMESLDLV